jgi:hypothetical protein
LAPPCQSRYFLAMTDPRNIERAVSIHYYGRGGSFFVQSLLDGHPDVLTFPANYMCGYFAFWDEFGHLPTVELCAAFVDCYDILFDPRSSVPVLGVGADVGQEFNFTAMGERHGEALGVDRDLFAFTLLRLLKHEIDDGMTETVERKFFFQALHVAYAEALGRQFDSANPLIVFQAHNPFFHAIDSLFSDFGPRLKCLHSVREPLQTLASWYHSMRQDEDVGDLDLPRDTLIRALAHASPIFTWTHHLSPDHQGVGRYVAMNERNTRAVRLEDLHQTPEATLQRLCRWLDIDWHEALLASTFDGKLWHWKVRGETLSGFQNQTISRRHDEVLSDFDRLRLQFLLADKHAAWGYEMPAWFRLAPLGLLALGFWLLPFRMETSLWSSRLAKGSAWQRSRAYLQLRMQVIGIWWRIFRRPLPLLELID